MVFTWWSGSSSYHYYLFHNGGRYHIETSPLVCRANQWTGFCMITVSVMKELISHLIFETILMKHFLQTNLRGVNNAANINYPQRLDAFTHLFTLPLIYKIIYQIYKA